MGNGGITYKAGYKYQLEKPYSIWTKIKPSQTLRIPFLTLAKSGYMHIKKGYAWDGPSGPAIDTKNFMRGSLVHDALYQLMDEGLLPLEAKEEADNLLYQICREDGMSWIRAWWVYWAVRLFGGQNPAPKPIYTT